jgi:hypothetical protein
MLDRGKVVDAIRHYIDSNLGKKVPREVWFRSLMANLDGCFNYLLKCDLGITEEMRDVFMVAAHLKYTMSGMGV